MRPRLDSIGPAEPTPRGGPSPFLTLILLLLAGGLIAILVAGYKAGTWGPVPANGQSSRTTVAPYVAIKTALDTGRKHLKENEAGKAEAVLREAVGEYPDDQDLRIALGEALMQLRSFPEAYQQYVAALAIGPRTPGVEFIAGTLASATGQPERAVEHYSAAQAGDPKNATYPLYLAQVQLKLNQPEPAKANLMLVTRLDPDSAIAWGTLAETALRENNVHIALQHIAKARALQPDTAAWRIIEARALKRKGDVEQALLVLGGLSPGEKKEPATLSLLAECYGLLDRPADAAGVFADASDAKPGDPNLAYEAATWFARADQNDKAAVFALRARENKHPQADKLLERLGKEQK
ncbi:MAG: tetratricopeptide repeat protein [Phycisphaerales bacterium]|nr:tetratricopeptide repeat protein [Phycisphaerales bacterium]